METYGVPWEKKKKKGKRGNENRDKEKGKSMLLNPQGIIILLL